jgi:hypothetical protein
MEHLSARIIKNKLGLLNLAQELGNVSKACKVRPPNVARRSVSPNALRGRS